MHTSDKTTKHLHPRFQIGKQLRRPLSASSHIPVIQPSEQRCLQSDSFISVISHTADEQTKPLIPIGVSVCSPVTPSPLHVSEESQTIQARGLPREARLPAGSRSGCLVAPGLASASGSVHVDCSRMLGFCSVVWRRTRTPPLPSASDRAPDCCLAAPCAMPALTPTSSAARGGRSCA